MSALYHVFLEYLGPSLGWHVSTTTLFNCSSMQFLSVRNYSAQLLIHGTYRNILIKQMKAWNKCNKLSENKILPETWKCLYKTWYNDNSLIKRMSWINKNMSKLTFLPGRPARPCSPTSPWWHSDKSSIIFYAHLQIWLPFPSWAHTTTVPASHSSWLSKKEHEVPETLKCKATVFIVSTDRNSMLPHTAFCFPKCQRPALATPHA